ncbi:MAG: DegV family protein [Herpetosiphon sp.]|nr:DegV family protein [Herpetosiphon sp.]
MPSVAIVTSPAASIPPDLIQRYAIHLVPFTIQFVDGNVRDSTDVDNVEFYQRLTTEYVVPNTNPPSPAQFLQTFRQIEADVVIVFHISAMISKSFEHANLAAQRIPERRIVNIDTTSVSLGIGLQVIAAAEDLAAGYDVDAVLERAYARVNHVLAITVPESVRFLRLSGRLKLLPGMIASFFGIIPVLSIQRGSVVLLERARSHEAALDTMIRHIQNFVADHHVHSLGISHTQAPALAEQLKRRLQPEFPALPLLINDAGPVLAVHIGPGAIALTALREL